MAPANYIGKVLPGINSSVSASLAVATKNGFADLSSRTIYWYLDGNLIGGGVGKQTITFQAPGHTEIMALRVTIPDYPTGPLTDTARIQIADPSVVIVAPYPNGVFSGSSVQLKAVPYFFPAAASKKLSYRWTVNGQTITAAENPQDLIINLGASTPPNYLLNVDLSVQRTDDDLTSANSNIALTNARQ
jgi:hypothetical protein